MSEDPRYEGFYPGESVVARGERLRAARANDPPPAPRLTADDAVSLLIKNTGYSLSAANAMRLIEFIRATQSKS